MSAINDLQGRGSKSARVDREGQTVEISVGRVATPPKPPSPITSPPISHREDTLKSGTEVYTVWFDDDVLGYEVNPIILSFINSYQLILGYYHPKREEFN